MDNKKRKEIDAFVARKLAALNKRKGSKAERAMTRIVVANKEVK